MDDGVLKRKWNERVRIRFSYRKDLGAEPIQPHWKNAEKTAMMLTEDQDALACLRFDCCSLFMMQVSVTASGSKAHACAKCRASDQSVRTANHHPNQLNGENV